MSAEHRNPSGEGDEAGADQSHPESVRTGVVASHGEREKRAYVAPVEVPKAQHRRLHTIDMSKVRISPDMKVAQLDPRNMATVKMDIPPGGIRPLPPPPSAEIADGPGSSAGGAAAAAGAAGASPWSQSAGIDRSMLPSAAMAPPAAQAGRPVSTPPPAKSSGGIGVGVWIIVILIAALLGGGIAFALRSQGAANAPGAASSSAPISITVPGTSVPAASPSPTEPDTTEPADEETTSTDVTTSSTSTPSKTTTRTAPRKTTTKTAPTAAPAPAPTTTSTAPRRLFN